MEPCETVFRMRSAGSTAQYFIDSGATSHYISEKEAVHDYVPFEVNRAITTADGSVPALGSGTLKFTSWVDGREKKAELKDVYYIPDIQTRLISYGKLLLQGWEPHSGHNGFTLRDRKGDLIVKAPMSNNVFTVTLQTTYPNFGLSAHEEREVSDDLLHKQLMLKYESPAIAFSTEEKEEPVSLFNWHRRMGHRSMRAILEWRRAQ